MGVTGSGHKRRFEVKWSDGTRTDETAWGIAIPGSAKALQVGRKRKRQHQPDLIASACEESDENEEGRQEEGKEDDSESEITDEDSGKYQFPLLNRCTAYDAAGRFLFGSTCTIHRNENS